MRCFARVFKASACRVYKARASVDGTIAAMTADKKQLHLIEAQQ
jgi:hypothetical protein